MIVSILEQTGGFDMVYLQKACDFFVHYDVCVLPSLFAAVWIFGVINWSANVYRKQNKLLAECQRKVLTGPKFTGVYVSALPREYLRQWRAYVNSKAERPSLVFEFVPRKKKTLCLPLFVACATVCTGYLALFFADTSHREYLVFQAAFWLSFCVVTFVNDNLFAKKEKTARQIFGKFVAQLNSLKNVPQMQTQNLAKELDKLKKDVVGDDALTKASTLLRQNGLEGNRSAEQQRKINTALNGLLQAYSRSVAHERSK